MQGVYTWLGIVKLREKLVSVKEFCVLISGSIEHKRLSCSYKQNQILPEAKGGQLCAQSNKGICCVQWIGRYTWVLLLLTLTDIFLETQSAWEPLQCIRSRLRSLLRSMLRLLLRSWGSSQTWTLPKFPFIAYCLLLAFSCWMLILKIKWKFGWWSCYYVFIKAEISCYTNIYA